MPCSVVSSSRGAASRRLCPILTACALFAASALTATAQSWTWDGGGNNNDWNTAANWTPNSVPTNAGNTQIIFDGNTRTNVVVDSTFFIIFPLDPVKTMKEIEFASGAGSFTLDPQFNFLNSLQIGTAGNPDGFITNNSSNAQTFNIRINTSGQLNIDGGTSSIEVSRVVNADTIAVNGGTLLLGADNVIGVDAASNNTDVNLAGGTLAMNGFSDTSVGALTLSADSVIDFNGGDSVLGFEDSSAQTWDLAATLTIQNWDGDLAGGGDDQLRFGNTVGALTAGQLARIRFLNPAGLSPGVYDARMLGSGEVVPVPEPGAIAAIMLIVGLVVARERRRILDCLARS